MQVSDLLERVFAVERARFAEFYPHVAGATVHVTDAPCSTDRCAYRDFAWCDPDTGEVWFSRRALRLPLGNIVGLIRHELGHLAEPGNFFWRPSEQHADDVAARVTGQTIRYDARDVQTVGPGKHPRPRYLHR